MLGVEDGGMVSGAFLAARDLFGHSVVNCGAVHLQRAVIVKNQPPETEQAAGADHLRIDERRVLINAFTGRVTIC
jgi:hypothetical protein